MGADFTRLPEGSQAAYAAAFRICATAVCSKQLESVYIADAYSNSRELELETSQLALREALEAKALVVTLEGALPAGVEPDYMQLCGLNATVAAGGSVRVNAVISGVCTENGAPRGVSVELSGSETITLEAGQSLRLTGLFCEEPSASAAGQVSALAQLTAEVTALSEIYPVCALEIGEENKQLLASRPSVTVLCAPGGDGDMWALAKKYGSTVAAIEAANSAEETLCAQTRPLLVPKAQ